jgi:hypothetical protein
MSLLEKYGILVDSLDMVEVNGSSYSGDGYETLTIERKKLTVERLLRNKCQVLTHSLSIMFSSYPCL